MGDEQPDEPASGASQPSGPPTYPQPPAPQPGYPPQGYGQPVYPGSPQPYGRPLAPDHPRATTILVLGILSLLCCGLFTGIPAIIMGSKAKREIDASRGTVGGRGNVQAGWVLGIVGTVWSILLLLLYVVLIVIAVVAPDTLDSGTGGGVGV